MQSSPLIQPLHLQSLYVFVIPKIGVPPNHPLVGFSMINNPFYGVPPFQETLYVVSQTYPAGTRPIYFLAPALAKEGGDTVL